MPEYIEREALIVKAQKFLGGSFSTGLIYEAIEKAPTADVVEVVRCKDCRCFVPIILNGKVQERGYCTLGCDWVNRKETDFCNYGERKEE